jgi:hypothetical protein
MSRMLSVNREQSWAAEPKQFGDPTLHRLQKQNCGYHRRFNSGIKRAEGWNQGRLADFDQADAQPQSGASPRRQAFGG